MTDGISDESYVSAFELCDRRCLTVLRMLHVAHDVSVLSALHQNALTQE